MCFFFLLERCVFFVSVCLSSTESSGVWALPSAVVLCLGTAMTVYK